MSLDFLRAMRSARGGDGFWDMFSRFKYSPLGRGGNGDGRLTKTVLLLLLVGSILGVGLYVRSAGAKSIESVPVPSAPARSDLPHLRRRIAACSPSDPCGFGLVADLDLKSKVSDSPLLFKSYFLGGRLTLDTVSNTYTVKFNPSPVEVFAKHNEAGRGLELSELILFKGKLFAFDDRTGIAFEYLPSGALVPRHLVTAGDGNAAKGMKVEWATEKDGQLWIGSFGKEYTDVAGKTVISEVNFWVAVLDPSGTIEYRNWKPIYQKLQKSCPSFFIHFVLESPVSHFLATYSMKQSIGARI